MSSQKHPIVIETSFSSTPVNFKNEFKGVVDCCLLKPLRSPDIHAGRAIWRVELKRGDFNNEIVASLYVNTLGKSFVLEGELSVKSIKQNTTRVSGQQLRTTQETLVTSTAVSDPANNAKSGKHVVVEVKMTVSDCGDLQQRFVSGEYARWRPPSSIHDNEDAKNGSLPESLGRLLFKSTLSDITIVVSGRNTRCGESETRAAAACAGGRKLKRNRPTSGATAQQVVQEMRSPRSTQTRKGKGVISARQLFAAHLTTYSLLLHTGQRTTKRSEQPSDVSSVTSESSFGSSSEWRSERDSKEASESVGIEIPAHSFVLAVRSPVFLSMLEANMLEAASRRIVVDGYSEDTVREFLTFMYTDKCPSLSTDGDEYEEDPEEPTIDRLQDLMELAHKYDVCRLFFLTETVLLERLTRENVEQLLLFAHRFDASRLREQSLQFIVDHRDTLPVPRDILSDPELACELYSLMSRVY